MKLNVKRIYDPVEKSDGYRVLVDRLWPRGVSREKAAIDLWLKEIGPSNELRKWFGHDPAKWSEFKKRYRSELSTNPALQQLKQLAEEQKLTLLFSAKDETHNQAQVLKDTLLQNQR